ncbi:ABC transporter ATP-binding protein [Aneurinibacillus sp. Ricciae_BoGa-3]|uniref:ABC transporter ATP-binding protein n=1 Tax=Aneurinibacillus sp. Ricciae_BoGa-3 TaxID=3022697 RepID=UPI00234043AF|nr:ABC transporter ATP-binding protein [Aneurinibacillus sp. Ricciae_BoGa-3]WCK54802.1 ABC transporter ATP-binding protein [Aneurinibacillus sp. Ricciae_BoGa-3]
MITFSSVSKKYDDGTLAVKSLDLTINEGEFFVLIGPSGCGKTTTLKMINRLIEPTQGMITIKNKDIYSYDLQQLRWNIGYVLQQIALFPHMTIAENIAVVPEMKRWDKNQIRNRVDQLLDMVGLEPETYRNRKPEELSGGQQQRVGVIRALAGNPDIILMDEPFSALDPISREQLQQDIRNLQKDIKKTIVFVTHDMNEALKLGDRICFMKDGQVVQLDTPQNLAMNPANDFVKEFIGSQQSLWLTPVEQIGETASLIGFHGLGQNEAIIPASLPLQEAVPLFEKYKVDLLYVEKNGQVMGTLSYKNIVEALADKPEGGTERI